MAKLGEAIVMWPKQFMSPAAHTIPSFLPPNPFPTLSTSHPPLPKTSYGFNMRVIKELALAEPLVDSVNPDQVSAGGHSST